jgi:DNA-binding XRE family transcriptional regulator
MTPQQFGQTIRNFRRRQKMTQRDLALVIDTGERFVIDLEAGKVTSQLGKALAAARAVGWHIMPPDPPAP